MLILPLNIIEHGDWYDIKRVALYGSTTVSETFGDENTVNVGIILPGCSFLIFEISKIPILESIPPLIFAPNGTW
ncbi:unnamed protein product, partial [Vitis vinifera]